MKLAIFGGTGPLGQQLVQQALDANNEVVVLARTPAKLEIQHPNLTVQQGDVLNPDDVSRTVKGADVVLSALGIRRLGYNTTVSEGTRNIINAMEQHEVCRLLSVSSVGVAESRPQAKTMGFLYHRILIPFVIGQSFEDKARQEQVIRDSNVQWTIVRPSSMINDDLTGKYTVTNEKDFGIQGDISRADVAHFMLNALDNQALNQRAVTVSY